ncbi:MAG TPA: molybdenum cofactor guanylyltransferase [Myxococcota bacterium]|nr:molybdenum cofactor guanylyltransferase [Myxococcota bacterium]
MKLPVYILAGGKSSRFGGDKARFSWRGRPLILQAAQSLMQFASNLTVVAERAGKYDDLGLHTIADGKPGQGPLGGIGAALRDARGSDWILCASCDRIGLKASWIEDLFAAAGQEACVVAFRDERWQPLPALYRTSITAVVEAALEAGRLSPWHTIESVASVGLPLPNEWDSSLDVNEPGVLSGG